MLKTGVQYIGIDYCVRGSAEDMIICDVNREKLPVIEADLAFMAGFLLYVKDLEAFAAQLDFKYLLFSYDGRQTFCNFGRFQGLGKLPYGENYKNLWEIIQLFLNNDYTLKAIKGRMLETCCLFEKNKKP